MHFVTRCEFYLLESKKKKKNTVRDKPSTVKTVKIICSGRNNFELPFESTQTFKEIQRPHKNSYMELRIDIQYYAGIRLSIFNV